MHAENNLPDTSSTKSNLPTSLSPTSPATSKLNEIFKKGGSNEMLTVYNAKMQVQYCRDVRRCHLGKAPSIGLVANGYGRNIAESWLELQLEDLSNFAGCKEKLDYDQRLELARMMIESYPYYKLTEFMLFFQRFKRCQYGRFYGAVDPMIIFQALQDFAEERNRELTKAEQEKRDAEKAEADRQHELLRQRYMSRVPDAFTPQAAINFLQYKLMGYDSMTDDQLKQECEEITSGAKTLPEEPIQMINYLKTIYDIKE